MEAFFKSRSECLSFVRLGLVLILVQSLVTSATPLYELVKNGASEEQIRKELKTNPSSVNLIEADGETALTCAVKQMNLEIVEILLNEGANPDCANRSGITPLQIADDLVREMPASKEILRLKQSYIDGGLSAEETERFLISSNAAYRAYISGHTKAESAARIKILLMRKLTEYRDSLEASPLFQATRVNRLDAVKNCFSTLDEKENAPINSRGENGQPPIIIAIMNFNVEICSILLDNGADMSIRDDTGRCALDYVRTLNDLFQKHRLRRDAMQLEQAIKNGSLVPDQADARGVTLLMRTAAMNNYDACKLLIEHGAKIDIKDIQGNTALEYIGSNVGNPCIEEKLRELLRTKQQ
ncbi:MAG: ankyrin repeat domain-containing protein [Lentisphaeria bacterium]|jgi:ankyrin repeat protein